MSREKIQQLKNIHIKSQKSKYGGDDVCMPF